MNIVLFAVVVLVLALLAFGFLKYLVTAFISVENKVNHIIGSLTCLILLVIGIYSAMVYTGSIDDPIEQGVFRESVIKREVSNVKITAPTIETKHPTDEEIYERQVKRFN